MASINDWAAKAALHIRGEVQTRPSFGSIHGSSELPSVNRIAAIIATHAEPLVALLLETRRDHETNCMAYVFEWDGGVNGPYGPCNCGADAWNARVESALAPVNGHHV